MTIPHAGYYRAHLALGWVLASLSGCSTDPAPPVPQVTDFRISVDSVTIEVQETTKIRASATIGTQRVDDIAVTWTSNRPEVATVSESGLVTGVTAGAAAITARLGSVERAAQVTVRGPLARIVVDQDSIDVIPLWTIRLVAAGEDAAGHPRPVSITWESSDSSVAWPVPGSVLGLRAGRATLTARSGNVSATVAAVVRPRAGVLTLLARNTLFDLALDGSNPVQWPIQPARLPDETAFAGFDWSETGRLLYACGDTRVCLVAPSGATEVVTVPTTRVFGPSWWPDNRRIMYGVQGGAQIFDPATRSLEAIPLTELPISIRVAPNGTSLAFVNLDNDYEGSVWVKDANGIRRVAGYCSDADWSPDGTRLAAACGDEVYGEHNGSPEGDFSLQAPADRVRWDPSGHLLAFLNVGSSVLFLSNPDGTGQMFWAGDVYYNIDEIKTFAWRRP